MIARQEAMILIVRHGPKRGREPHYNRPHLKAIKRRDPALYRRLRFHETGMPRPSLDGIGAVVFWLGDPLRELYPDCFAEAIAIAEEARARGLNLVNPPEALSNTIKTVQSGLWRAAGIPTPPYTRCDDRDALMAHLETADLPVLIRRDEHHGQRPTRTCQSRADAARLGREWPHFPCSVAPLIDVRQIYRDAGHEDHWATHHHVRRVMIFGATILPQRVFFSPSQIVSHRNNTFKAWQQRSLNRRLLRALPSELKDHLQAEIEYRARGVDAPDLMRKAAETLGLQYLAIDYCGLPDGRVILWEANPYHLLMPLRDSAAWRERRLHDHYPLIYDTLIKFLREQLPD